MSGIIASVPFLRQVRLQDFLLYEDEAILFPRGVTIVTGRNGAGKSLLIDGIRLGLGMDPRSVRMDSLGAYVRSGCQQAQIEITLSNPIVGGERFITSIEPKFAMLLNQDSVTIRRTISKSGRSKFFIKSQSERWTQLSPDQAILLISALAKVGIDPQDPLAFVPADDFNVFVQENPNDRFRMLVEKLGLQTAERQYLEAQKKIKSKLEDTQKYEKELEVANITLSQLKERYDLWKTKERLEKRITNLQCEMEWIPVRQAQERVSTLEKSVEKLQTEITEREEDITQSSEDESVAAINLDQQREIVAKFTKDLEIVKNQQNATQTQITTKHEQIQNNKKRISIIENKLQKNYEDSKKIRTKLKTAREASPDNQLRSLEEEKMRIDRELNSLEEERKTLRIKTEKYFETKIQIHLNKHKELRLSENTLVKKLKQSRKRKDKFSKKQTIPWNQDILEFRRRIRELELDDRVYGPLGSECSIDHNNEPWRKAISTALSNLLMDFIALDKEAFDALVELRNSEGFEISIGYIEGMDLLEFPKELEEDDHVHCYITDVLTAPPFLKAYIARWGGEHILTQELDQKTAQELAGTFSGLKFVSYSGSIFSATQDSYRYSISGKTRSNLLGYQFDGIGQDSDPNIATLEKSLQEVREEGNLAKKTYENLSHKDPEYQKLLNRQETLTKEIGVKEREVKAFEVSMDKINISPLTERLQERLRSHNQEEISQKGELRALENQIEEIQSNIADLEISIAPLKKKIRQLELGKVKRQKIIEDAIRFHQKTQEEKSRVTDNLEELRDTLYRETDTLKEVKVTAITLEKKVKKKVPKAPKKIRSKVVVSELLEELETDLTDLNKKKLSSTDEKNFEKHLNFTKGISNQLTKRKNELQRLQSELEHWKSCWIDVFNAKLQTVQAIFDEILQSVGGRGRIEVIGQEKPEKGETFVWVSFGDQEERSLGRQSSGERQAGLVALIIALQSQSISPISTIDEFDRGLDAANKARLVSIIPRMIESTSQLLGEDRIVAQQFLIICPEIEDIPDGVNFLTVVRSGDLSQLEAVPV